MVISFNLQMIEMIFFKKVIPIYVNTHLNLSKQRFLKLFITDRVRLIYNYKELESNNLGNIIYFKAGVAGSLGHLAGTLPTNVLISNSISSPTCCP